MSASGAKAARVAGFFLLMLGGGVILDHGNTAAAVVLLACGGASFLVGLASLRRSPKAHAAAPDAPLGDQR